MTLFEKFVSYLTPGHFEGIVLFFVSTVILTVVHVLFKKEWTNGLKGPNGYWEGPEIFLYICSWVFGPMIFADQFLAFHPSDMAWYTFWIALVVGFFGRWGLEWLLAFKSGSNQVTSTTSIEKKTTEVQKETTTQ